MSPASSSSSSSSAEKPKRRFLVQKEEIRINGGSLPASSFTILLVIVWLRFAIRFLLFLVLFAARVQRHLLDVLNQIRVVVRVHPAAVRIFGFDHFLVVIDVFDLLAAFVAWHVFGVQKLFVLGKVRFQFVGIAGRPVPGRTMVDQVITGLDELFRRETVRISITVGTKTVPTSSGVNTPVSLNFDS